jgi:hypothetical protein
MTTFVFDEEEHRYYLKGELIPSVTTVIGTVLNHDYSNIDPWYADFGTAVHKVVELDIIGALDESSVMPEALVCLKAFREFKEKAFLENIYSETRGYNEDLWVAGTMDIVANLHDGKYIIDIKTKGKRGTKNGWHKIQTAGYSLIYNKEQKNPPKRGALYLFREGGYEFVPHPDPRDISMFVEMTKVYHGLGRYK